MAAPHIDPLGTAFRRTLESLHAGAPQLGSDGLTHPIDATTRISEDEGRALFSLATDRGVCDTLEVGLAYGFSTTYLLAAVAANGSGSHTAIDPFQETDWQGIGVSIAGRLVDEVPSLGPGSFAWRADRSEGALVDLAREGRTFGFIFIDGYHRFDDVLVDFTLSARLCPVGGAIALHDMWLDSVAAVASFIRRDRRDFAPIDTGCDNLFAVRRVDADRRDWSHFAPFPMRPPGPVPARP